MAPTPIVADLAPAFLSFASSFEALPNVTFGPFAARQYTPDTGSCGWTNTSSQYVASIKVNNTRSGEAFCGREIEVETDIGSVTATIVDACLSCGYDYLALAEAAFEPIHGDDDEPRIVASYTWTTKDAGAVEKKEHSSPKADYTPASSSSSSKKADYTPASSSSSSKEAEYTPSSSSSKYTPEYTSSSSSKTPEWTPSSSSKTPEYTPSSSSSSSYSKYTPDWTPKSSSKTPEYTPSSSSSKYTPEYTPSSTSQAPAYTPKQQQSSGGGAYSGQATYFYQGGNPGACGNYNQDSAYIVALDYRMYGGGSHCGQSVRITNNNNGNSITAQVADLCPSCASSGSLDLSVAAFQALGSMDAGVLPISWSFA